MGHKRYPKSSILWTGKRRRNGKRMDWNCISCLKPRAFGRFSEAHGLFFARLEFCENHWRSVFLVENLNFRWEKKGWREETVKISKFGRETVKKPLFWSGSNGFAPKLSFQVGTCEMTEVSSRWRWGRWFVIGVFIGPGLAKPSIPRPVHLRVGSRAQSGRTEVF